jgi:hypothetical protein
MQVEVSCSTPAESDGGFADPAPHCVMVPCSLFDKTRWKAYVDGGL